MDQDEELHKAWVDACMDVAHDFAEEYCNMQCDGTRSYLEATTAHRTKLRNMLWDVPASMALTDPELRAGMELQRKEIDRLKQQLRDEGDRIAELKRAIEAMRVAGGSGEFQMAFDIAKALIVPPNDRVEGRDAALSRRVPSHDGLCGNGSEVGAGDTAMKGTQ